MYAADVDSTLHTFQASGSLWQDALVMQDRETGSLWSQMTGECIQGELEGKTLTLVPSIHTTFAEFKRLYPNGLVLRKPERGEAGSTYDKYFNDPDKLGIFGRINDFERAPAKLLIYGLRIGSEEIAISSKHLAKKGWELVESATRSVIVTYDPASHTASAIALDHPSKSVIVVWSETPNVFSSDGKAAWDPRTGRCEKGNVDDLEPMPLLSAYWFAWASFFPDTRFID